MADQAPPSRFSVFEAVNESLKEFFIGTTSAESPPGFEEGSFCRCVAHWSKEHKISSRVVERGLALDDAVKFVENYARSAARTGWVVLTD